MKKFLEKILDKYIEYKKRQEEEEMRNKHNICNYNKYNLDDYDDWTEDEAEDLLTGGKEGLLHN